MPEPTNTRTLSVGTPGLLAELRETLDSEISICGPMGIEVVSFDDRGLAVSMPLAPNKNHQATAFAGSLNALCTLAGWGSVFLLTRLHARRDSVVIRRSSIRYLRPVAGELIVARCATIDAERQAHFLEMLREKGQSKLDLDAEICCGDEPAVVFHGSYVAFENT